MIISRIIPVLRTGIATKKIVLVNGGREARLAVQSVRWSGDTKYLYREVPKEKDKLYTILATTFWWWTLWYLIMDYDEFLGPVMPDPSKWTDEELGIPPV